MLDKPRIADANDPLVINLKSIPEPELLSETSDRAEKGPSSHREASREPSSVSSSTNKLFGELIQNSEFVQWLKNYRCEQPDAASFRRAFYADLCEVLVRVCRDDSKLIRYLTDVPVEHRFNTGFAPSHYVIASPIVTEVNQATPAQAPSDSSSSQPSSQRGSEHSSVPAPHLVRAILSHLIVCSEKYEREGLSLTAKE